MSAPEVMDWGNDVLRVMEAIAAKQNADGARSDALKTQQALVVLSEWLDDMDDAYVHDEVGHFTVKEPPHV